MKHIITDSSIRKPKHIISLMLIITAIFVTPLFHLEFENNREHSLPQDSPVLANCIQASRKFDLEDSIIVGIVNEEHPDGVFNIQTLTRIYNLTSQLSSLRCGANDGKAVITIPANDHQQRKILVLDLSRRKLIDYLFMKNHNSLFDEHGNSVINIKGIISPSTVVNIKRGEIGMLKSEPLVPSPPATRDEALVIRKDALGNSLYAGTLFSEDGKAACIYIPINDVSRAHIVSRLVTMLTKDWHDETTVLITGPSIIQDQFNREMLLYVVISTIIMLICAFCVMTALFHGFVSLAVAPVISAIITIICSLGVMTALGIKADAASCIAVFFLIIVAIMNSVHVLSEFFDACYKFNNKNLAIRNVSIRLFKPMIYANIAITAGFIALTTTSGPAIRAFGTLSAIGTIIAWLLAITFIPAYVIIAISPKTLSAIWDLSYRHHERPDWLGGTLRSLGIFNCMQWKPIITLTAVTCAILLVGTRWCSLNSNSVGNFAPYHTVQTSNNMLRKHLPGTHLIHLSLHSAQPRTLNYMEKISIMRSEAQKRFAPIFPQATKIFTAKLNGLEQLYLNATSGSAGKHFATLVREAEDVDRQALVSWNELANALVYVNPENLSMNKLAREILKAKNVDYNDKKLLLARLEEHVNLKDIPLLDKTLEICSEFTRLSFREFVFEMEAELNAPPFKQASMLNYINTLQSFLMKNSSVAKTTSAVDALKQVSYELNYATFPGYDNISSPAYNTGRNSTDSLIPRSASAADKMFTQLEGLKNNTYLRRFVTKDFQNANIQIQLKTSSTRNVNKLITDINNFMLSNPPPVKLNIAWTGPAYMDTLWQHITLNSITRPAFYSFITIIMVIMLLFRSPLYGLLGSIPLLITMVFIFGLMGFARIQINTTTAILAAVIFAISVDFTVNFLERARLIQARHKSWHKACLKMFHEPTAAITRNTIIVSISFLSLIALPLTPCKTAGWLIAVGTFVCLIVTLLVMPALLTALRKLSFSHEEDTFNLEEEEED